MNNGNPPAMQGPRHVPRAVLSINPTDIICAKCVQTWERHAPGCPHDGIQLAPAAPDPDALARSVFELAFRMARGAAELLDEAQRAVLDDLTPDQRALILPDLSAAVDAAATLRERLARRVVVFSSQSPGGF